MVNGIGSKFNLPPLDRSQAPFRNDNLDAKAQKTKIGGVEFLNRLEESQRIERDRVQMDQTDMLSMMTTQLSNQDPFKPVENDQMISQMASFSSIEGISKMTKTLDHISNSLASNQALQASSLIGQKVLLPRDNILLSDSAQVSGVVNEPNVRQLSVSLLNEQGEVVSSQRLGDFHGSQAAFNFDAKSLQGLPLPKGSYQVAILGIKEGGIRPEPLSGSFYSKVQSVSLGSIDKPSTLFLEGGSKAQFSDIQQIMKGTS